MIHIYYTYIMCVCVCMYVIHSPPFNLVKLVLISKQNVKQNSPSCHSGSTLLYVMVSVVQEPERAWAVDSNSHLSEGWIGAGQSTAIDKLGPHMEPLMVLLGVLMLRHLASPVRARRKPPSPYVLISDIIHCHFCYFLFVKNEAV